MCRKPNIKCEKMQTFQKRFHNGQNLQQQNVGGLKPTLPTLFQHYCTEISMYVNMYTVLLYPVLDKHNHEECRLVWSKVHCTVISWHPSCNVRSMKSAYIPLILHGVYSELPLIWTPEMWPPLYSGHFEKSQNM